MIGNGAGANDIARIERLAYGYELMHGAICNMAGTSGAEARWYMQEAQQILARVSSVWSINADSNPPRPGDCLSAYRRAVPTRVANAIAAIEEARAVLSETPELNMSNYDADDVAALNAGMIAVYKILDRAALAQEDSRG